MGAQEVREFRLQRKQIIEGSVNRSGMILYLFGGTKFVLFLVEICRIQLQQTRHCFRTSCAGLECA